MAVYGGMDFWRACTRPVVGIVVEVSSGGVSVGADGGVSCDDGVVVLVVQVVDVHVVGMAVEVLVPRDAATKRRCKNFIVMYCSCRSCCFRCVINGF